MSTRDPPSPSPFCACVRRCFPPERRSMPADSQTRLLVKNEVPENFTRRRRRARDRMREKYLIIRGMSLLVLSSSLFLFSFITFDNYYFNGLSFLKRDMHLLQERNIFSFQFMMMPQRVGIHSPDGREKKIILISGFHMKGRCKHSRHTISSLWPSSSSSRTSVASLPLHTQIAGIYFAK